MWQIKTPGNSNELEEVIQEGKRKMAGGTKQQYEIVPPQKGSGIKVHHCAPPKYHCTANIII